MALCGRSRPSSMPNREGGRRHSLRSEALGLGGRSVGHRAHQDSTGGPHRSRGHPVEANRSSMKFSRGALRPIRSFQQRRSCSAPCCFARWVGPARLSGISGRSTALARAGSVTEEFEADLEQARHFDWLGNLTRLSRPSNGPWVSRRRPPSNRQSRASRAAANAASTGLRPQAELLRERYDQAFRRVG